MSAPLVGRDVRGAPRTFLRHAPRAARVLRAPTHGRDALLHGRSAEVFQPSDSEKDARRETRAPSPSPVSRLMSFRFTSHVSCLMSDLHLIHVNLARHQFREKRITHCSPLPAVERTTRSARISGSVPHLPMKRRTANLSETPRSRCNVQVISLTRGSRKIANAWSTANRTSRSRCRFRS